MVSGWVWLYPWTVLRTVYWPGAALGPTAAGFIYDATGTYVPAFTVAACGLALSSAFFTFGTASSPERRT